MTYRIAFDASLPVIVSTEILAGGRRFKAGEIIDWQAMSISQEMLYDWWRAGLVHHQPLPVVTADPDELTEAELEKLTAPQSQAKRNQRKR